MNKLIIALFSLIAASGCKRALGPCSATDPGPQSIRISLIDPISERSLIGTDRMYHPDSINRLNNGLEAKFSAYDDDTTVRLQYYRVKSGKPYSFHLNKDVRHELTLDYIVTKGECFDGKELINLNYNGKDYNPNEWPITVNP